MVNGSVFNFQLQIDNYMSFFSGSVKLQKWQIAMKRHVPMIFSHILMSWRKVSLGSGVSAGGSLRPELMDAINCKLESNWKFRLRNSTLPFEQLDQTYKTRTKDGLLWSLKFDEGHRRGKFCSINIVEILQICKCRAVCLFAGPF